jgi:hypothetical protein
MLPKNEVVVIWVFALVNWKKRKKEKKLVGEPGVVVHAYNQEETGGLWFKGNPGQRGEKSVRPCLKNKLGVLEM